MYIPAEYPTECASLNKFIERATRDDLIRLNTYLRRYIAPQVAYELFLEERLETLLQPHELKHVVALTLDIRGFVRTTHAGETKEEVGLSSVANWLRRILSEVIRIAFENRGLVGELSGDRVMVIFGFPAATENWSQLDKNVQRAVRAALAIQDMVQAVKSNLEIDETLRNFDLGIGVCAGGPAWIGPLENEWRQELMVVSTVANVASRAEELTKNAELMADIPGRKIIVNEAVVNSFETGAEQRKFKAGSLGEQDVRGLEGTFPLYHLQEVAPELLHTTEPVTDGHIEFVHWLSDYLDGALERDNLRRVRQALSEVGQLVIAEQERESVFSQLMEQIIRLFGAEKASLYRVDLETKELIFEESVGHSPPPRGLRLPAGTGIAGAVVKSQRPVLIADLHQDTRWYRGIGEQANQRSMMCVPLVAEGVTIGLIQVIAREPNAFSTQDLTALEAFAGPAATAVVNAQRYEHDSFEKRVRQVQGEITQALATLDLDQVLDMVMTQAVQNVLSPRSATLYTLKETGELEFTRVLSKTENLQDLVGQRLPPGQGIAGMVAQSKQAYISADTHQDPDWLRDKDPEWLETVGQQTRSMMCVPMMVKEEVVGVIQAIDDRPGVFNQNHLDVLKWLAASAAIAVDNAARYRALEETHEKLEKTHQKLKETQERFVAAETMAGLGHIAGKLAHNLTNDISAIRTNAKWLLKGRRTPEVVAEKILVLADDAMAEIKSIREPLQRVAGERETDLCQALKEISKETLVALEKQRAVDGDSGVSILLELASPSLWVQGSKDQVKYIFQNLLRNSLRAIERKGEQGQIIIREVQTELARDGCITIEVVDTGVGISEEAQKRIFELGYTDKPEGEIGGYGLFYVALTLQSLGGYITLTSQEGVGTTFNIQLPLAKQNGEET